MSRKFESIKKQIEALNRINQGNLHNLDRRQQLLKFVDSCSKISYCLAGETSGATYQKGSDSDSEIAEGLKPLKRDLEIMQNVISELGRINEESLNQIEEKLNLINS